MPDVSELAKELEALRRALADLQNEVQTRAIVIRNEEATLARLGVVGESVQLEFFGSDEDSRMAIIAWTGGTTLSICDGTGSCRFKLEVRSDGESQVLLMDDSYGVRAAMRVDPRGDATIGVYDFESDGSPRVVWEAPKGDHGR